MEFKATLSNSRILRGVIEAFSYLQEETNLFATPAGMKMSDIDDSRVAMLYAELQKELFVDYSCPEEFKIGVNIADMIKILRRAKSSDKIILEHQSENPNDILIRMISDKSKRTFRLKSKTVSDMGGMEEEEKKEDILQQLEETFRDKFTASITMDGTMLDEIMKDAMIVSDTIRVHVLQAENVINFVASDETGEVEVEIDLDGGVLDYNVTGDSEGTYALNFLDNIIKIQSVIDNINISIGSNIPIKLEGNILTESGDGTGGKVVYLLAPRVDDDDDDFEEDFEPGDFDNTFDEEFEEDFN